MGISAGLGLGLGLASTPTASSAEKSPSSVFAFGSNSHGQLGSGSSRDQFEPLAIDSDLNLDVVDVQAFGHSSVLLTSSGDVYTFGRSLNGSIGQGGNGANCAVPALVKELSGQGIVKVALGEFHMAALGEDGRLWTAGRGWSGELARAAADGDVTRPAAVVVAALPDVRFVDVACGSSFTALVDSEGAVYTCGAGRQGVLGLGEDVARTPTGSLGVPTRIDTKALGGAKAVQVAAGEECLLILTDAGRVYSCGNDDYGTLGAGGTGPRIQSTPQLVSSLTARVSHIFAGDYHCACVTADAKELFTWGRGADGCLGHGSTRDMAVPTKVGALAHAGEKVAKVALGGSHSLVLGESGRLFAFGKGRSGQLGSGDELESVAAPRKLPHLVKFFDSASDSEAGRKIVALGAGRDHSLCITKAGSE